MMIISDVTGYSCEEIDLTARFVQDLDMESLDALDLCFRLEREFEVMIPMKEAKEIHTVGAAIAYCSKSVGWILLRYGKSGFEFAIRSLLWCIRSFRS